MVRNVLFVDLTHTGKVIDANYIPLAIGYIAAYAVDNLEGEISPPSIVSMEQRRMGLDTSCTEMTLASCTGR